MSGNPAQIRESCPVQRLCALLTSVREAVNLTARYHWMRHRLRSRISPSASDACNVTSRYLSQTNSVRKDLLEQFIAVQENPHILLKPKIHHHAHKSPPLDLMKCQFYPVHSPTFYFAQFHFNISVLLVPPSGLFLRFYNQNVAWISYVHHASCMYRLSHPSWFNQSNISWRVFYYVNEFVQESWPYLQHS